MHHQKFASIGFIKHVFIDTFNAVFFAASAWWATRFDGAVR